MKHGPVAIIRFRPLRDGAAPRPAQRFAGMAKLPTDPPDAPFGQWTLCAELWSPPDTGGTSRAWVQFLSPDAPADALRPGERFVLYDGKRPAADVRIAVALVEPEVPVDDDFLAGERVVPRRVA
jgi:hypothetical protein